MPRKPRMYMPGVPCDVSQNGNKRDVCFYSEQDYHFYLKCLRSACKRYRVTVHAYVLKKGGSMNRPQSNRHIESEICVSQRSVPMSRKRKPYKTYDIWGRDILGQSKN